MQFQTLNHKRSYYECQTSKHIVSFMNILDKKTVEASSYDIRKTLNLLSKEHSYIGHHMGRLARKFSQRNCSYIYGFKIEFTNGSKNKRSYQKETKRYIITLIET